MQPDANVCAEALPPGHNRLLVLAADIRSAHASVSRNAAAMAEAALAAGRALVEAKAAVTHGGWADWLAANTGLSARSARRYMQLARSGLQTATVADLGIKGAAKSLARASRSIPPQPASDGDRQIQALIFPAEAGRFHIVVVDLARSELVSSKRAVPEELIDASLVEAGLSPTETTLSAYRVPLEQAHLYGELNALLADNAENAS